MTAARLHDNTISRGAALRLSPTNVAIEKQPSLELEHATEETHALTAAEAGVDGGATTVAAGGFLCLARA